MQTCATACNDVREQVANPLRGVADYKFVRFVGRGSFGYVVHAVDRKTQESVAIKLIPRGGDLDVERVRREIMNHRNLFHFHVIRFHRLILTPTHLGIVMEYAEGGNLKDYLRQSGGVNDYLARFLFQQLVVSVEYCHGMNVVNRDIKLQNTLVTGNSEWPLLKICDFGYSKHEIADSKPDSRVGTRQTMPPEVILLQSGEDYDGVLADIWCIGLFLYYLVVNRYPFCGNGEQISDAELFRRIVCLEYEIPEWVPSDCAHLIQAILVRDPEARPSIPQIKSHPYFLRNLPKGAIDMNTYLKRQRSEQNVEEMTNILLRARGSRSSV